MVFKKPYAFFIKYFKLINLILCILNGFFIYKLNVLHNALDNVYFGKLTNYINMDSTYIGYLMYLLIFLISIIVLVIILTLRKKQKPYRDYLYNLIYNVILFAYLLAISNLFLELNSTVIEQTSLKLYSDISLLVIFPLIYFLLKYILIVIGFSINKFNFQKDIVELKQTEEDSEEIELIFNKNTYKTKRTIRKTARELKYYILENKLIVSIIIGVILLIPIISIFSINFFDKNNVRVRENFVAGNFSYKILNVYETEYDSRNNIINKDYKFVMVETNIRNNFNLGQSIDFKRIRLFYGNEYVYANNFYNKYLNEFNPYNEEILNAREDYIYTFVFKVPKNYKSNSYLLKFYDRVVYNENETIGNYKKIKVNAKSLDKKQKENIVNLNENVVLNKDSFGNSNITINEYSLENNYVYNNGEKDIIIRDKNVNNILLLIKYKFEIDNNAKVKIEDEKDFFQKYVSLKYTINNQEKNVDKISIINYVDNKIFIGVPYNIKDANNINMMINLRNNKIIYKLK